MWVWGDPPLPFPRPGQPGLVALAAFDGRYGPQPLNLAGLSRIRVWDWV